MSKLIALTQRVECVEVIGERRDALSQEWAALADACGFLPLPLPNRLGTVQQLLVALPVEGIILTGGNDLAPYGGDALERDALERYLIQYSMEKRVSLLGVCRGMQMLLDYFGTPLGKVDGHVRTEHLLDTGDTVNSFHSWGAQTCKAPLEAVAHSADGVLETVVHRKYPWVRGIMWHPERYAPLRERDIQFIKEVFRL